MHPSPRCLLPLALLAGACATDPYVDVTLQQLRAQRIGAGGFLALDLLATHEGSAIPCDDGTFTVAVSVTAEGPGGHFTELPPQSFVVACDDGRTGDLALVVDNSGSQDGFLPWLQQAARTMADEVIARGGRTSLVRVSTQAELVQPLTAAPQQIHDAIDGLFIANGWTALWDGVRLGNASLGGTGSASGTRTAIEDFCFAQRPLGVVTFTDGADNNSSNEKRGFYNPDRYPDDGVDTTLDDLRSLRTGDSVTPLYTLGLGADVDHASLADLAASTGARHRAIDTAEQIPEVFGVLQSYFDATHQVCVELPELQCGELIVRVDWSWEGPGSPAAVTGRSEQSVTYACATQDVPVEGRVATLLLTLGDPGIPVDLASTLARQAVEWTTPKLRPQVLVVLDDAHNGEDITDHDLVQWLLDDIDTLEVTFLDEPPAGLTPADVEGYDVVWFANPGYPMDDELTFLTLSDFVEAGGGLVLQGDDMTWSRGRAFPMDSLTGLTTQGNGTQACGVRIDNRTGSTYTVTVLDEDHAVTRGLQGTTFTYANDIDASTVASPWAEVLATASPTLDPDCQTVPVIVGYSR